MPQFKLPTIYGELPNAERIIYFSCDGKYYKEFGIPLIKSIIHQIDWINVHCHVISKKNIDFLEEFPRTTYTYEIIDQNFIDTIPLSTVITLDKSDVEINAEIVYYSCSRFMQLDKIFNETQRVFQIDCDSLLFNPFTEEDFIWLTDTPKPMRKNKKPDGVIASAISFGVGSEGQQFRNLLSTILYDRFSKDAFWFIDQIVLRDVFKRYNFENIPLYWNTWNKYKKIAFFQTAKGDKKNNNTEYLEKRQYWLNY